MTNEAITSTSSTTTHPPPPGRDTGGIWGTTTYIGPRTWAVALASMPSIIGTILILLFYPLDSMDVYQLDGKLFTADGQFYKSSTVHNFEVMQSKHVVGTVPPKRSPDGEWGTTQYVGNLTIAMAIAALPTILGPFIILLFMPLDNRDIYKDGESLYRADGTWFKTASQHNFDIRRSVHTKENVPDGIASAGMAYLTEGMWGTTTYVGPLTWASAIVAAPTILGSFLILMFCPLDQEEVYRLDGKLYLPNGQVYKTVTDHNFDVKNSDHTIDNVPTGRMGGEWGTTTYIGPLTCSLTIMATLAFGLGWIIVLMFCPVDSHEVYNVDGKLYLPNGKLYKNKTNHNFFQLSSKHLTTSDTVRDVTVDVAEYC